MLFLLVSSLIVGMQLQDPPFEMVAPDGKPTGVSVELAKRLSTYLERELIIQDLPFVALIPALQSKKIDCIISSMTVTENRSKIIDFSDPYIRTGLCLLISMKSTLQNIHDADQKGRVIVVKQGTSGEQYALAHLKLATLLALGEEAACVLEVVQGKADAFIFDKYSIVMHQKRNPKTTRALLTPFQEESWAIGLRKNDPLKPKINAFLKTFNMQELLNGL